MAGVFLPGCAPLQLLGAFGKAFGLTFWRHHWDPRVCSTSAPRSVCESQVVPDLAMYHNPLVYCTCWDPRGLGPRKLIKTPQPLSKASWRRANYIFFTFGLTPLLPVSKEHNYLQPPPATKPTLAPEVSIHPGRLEDCHKSPQEVIRVSPGYQLARNREQISVTVRDEMFSGEKQLELEIADRANISRANIICDLEEQISELTIIIEQMNRDHQAARKLGYFLRFYRVFQQGSSFPTQADPPGGWVGAILRITLSGATETQQVARCPLLCNEMERRCDEMKQNFEDKTRALTMAHKAELTELENNYREALKAEKSAAHGKLEEMQKEYKYLKNMFHLYQDTIHEEMEDKWSKRKAEWEEGEKMEREKILLQQKYKMTKKFELESEEEKRGMSESYSVTFESFMHEKEIIEEELHAQALILESLNTNLYQTQLELQREVTPGSRSSRNACPQPPSEAAGTGQAGEKLSPGAERTGNQQLRAVDSSIRQNVYPNSRTLTEEDFQNGFGK
ncbi:Amyotrophic lateral sclerosis 2 chromosomal region candidate gene 12 protein-like protein [Heterocephalus glaber]|uniref:Amyotrophic lateral sclerosis 2 chromosomal region candidate gene 12 protein-like protein n=1 Tax=Heterocephalus glaber TaxID=10181 RepID=G5BW36_HETGA|nr:Amyotrophic lateral sclerosis 2 chromosomal region candidate gene 12 protein-like protein [Heterocephalus glaber]